MKNIMLLIVVSVCAGTAAGQAPEYETTRVGEGVYQFRYRSHNGFFVTTPGGVVAVDPISPVAARHYAAEIKRVAPNQALRAIVYSHDHQDHAAGAAVLNDAFPGRAPIIAHENAVPKIASAADPNVPPPDLTFSDRLTLRSSGRTVELVYLGKSHSDNMLVVYVPDARTAFAVDFVSNDRVGYRELPDYHFPEFFETLGRLAAIDFETIVFGHGPPGDPASIQRQIRYYTALREAVTDAHRRGWSEDEAAAQVRLPEFAGWGQYEAWFPLNVRAIYRWVAGAGSREP